MATGRWSVRPDSWVMKLNSSTSWVEWARREAAWLDPRVGTGLDVGLWGPDPPARTHSLPVGAQPILSVQHVVDAPAISLQQVLAPLLAAPWALAGGEGKVLSAAFLTLQDPVAGEEEGTQCSEHVEPKVGAGGLQKCPRPPVTSGEESGP